MHLRHILKNCGQRFHCRRSSRGTTMRSSFRRPASRTWLYITQESSLRTCAKSCLLRLSKMPALSYRATSCTFPIMTAILNSIKLFPLTSSSRKSMLSTAAINRRQSFISDVQSFTSTNRERNSLILSLTSTYIYIYI